VSEIYFNNLTKSPNIFLFLYDFLLLIQSLEKFDSGHFYFSEKPFVELKSKAEEKAKMYYLSCMDSNETIEALGPKPMLNLLKKVGGWNISAVGGKPFNVSAWDLQNTIQTLQNRYNMGGLFSWAVGEDDRNSSRHVIQVRI
jgi:endothelin-converting enzyme